MGGGHAVVCMRDREIFVWGGGGGGGGGGVPASTEKSSVLSIYRVSWRGPYQYSYGNLFSTCDFRGGEGVRSLTDFTKGVVTLLVQGSYQYSIPMETYSTYNFLGGGGVRTPVLSLNPPAPSTYFNDFMIPVDPECV